MRQVYRRQARELRTFCGLMNLSRGGAAFCLCLASIVASPAFAQQSDAQRRIPILTIRLNTDLVRILIPATPLAPNIAASQTKNLLTFGIVGQGASIEE
jgi:hypothetical protein